MKISAFIITLNEASRIRYCLESVKWVDDLVVVDMHSDDATLDIAREYTDKIFSFERADYCEPARAFAAQKTTGDWILNLDADEIMTLGLKRELLRLAQQGQYQAAYVPRKNYFWGEEMRYAGCGQFQDRPLRFYKRDAVSFNKTIHAGIQLKEMIRAFKISDPQAHLLHFSYLSPEQFWEKMDRYATIEAKALFEAQRDYSFKAALKNTWKAFWKRYLKKGKGYKDRAWGFIYCVWTAVYQLNVYAKYALMRKYQKTNYAADIEKKYAQIISQALTELSSAERESTGVQ